MSRPTLHGQLVAGSRDLPGACPELVRIIGFDQYPAGPRQRLFLHLVIAYPPDVRI
ncbi:hypothetical protein [Desulfosporosinus fructosivorans]